jgi:hypothetical protein
MAIDFEHGYRVGGGLCGVGVFSQGLIFGFGVRDC